MKHHSRVMGGRHRHIGGPNAQVFASGGRHHRLTGGPESADVDFVSYTDDERSEFPFKERDSFVGPDKVGGDGIAFINVMGGSFVSGPIGTAARLAPAYARHYFWNAQAQQPFAPLIQSAIIGPGPNVLVLSNPDPNTKKEFCGILIQINAPSLLNLPANTVQVTLSGFNDNGGVMNFAEPGAPAGQFRFQMERQSQGTLELLLIPTTVIQSRAIATRIALANNYQGFGNGFAAAVNADLTVTFDGAPDGAQADVTALTPQHPKMMNLLALAERQVNSLALARS